MSPIAIRIIGILLFALVTAILFAVGMAKERDKQQDLSVKLYVAGEKKVKKLLSRNGKMTKIELQEALTGLKAGLFYSREKAIIQDPSAFTKNLLEQMEKRHIIVLQTEKGKKYYKLAFEAQKEQELS